MANMSLLKKVIVTRTSGLGVPAFIGQVPPVPGDFIKMASRTNMEPIRWPSYWIHGESILHE
jgi:hypothetical protein